MLPLLRTILDHFTHGLVPIDGDVRRPDRGTKASDRCPEDPPCHAPRPRVQETAWMASTILFGPPL